MGRGGIRACAITEKTSRGGTLEHEGGAAAGRGTGVLRYDGGRLAACDHRPVEEHPLALVVNGAELATLVASPHDLPSLVAGFLRMQRFVTRADDILSMGICADARVADVRIRGELPARLVPTLTSGCGTGITFRLPGPATGMDAAVVPEGGRFAPDAILALMDELARLAEGYRGSGGIHSAAAGRDGKVLLFAEDIGRHNTIDRIAGRAMLEGRDLSGTALVASGRVSSEMAGKAALLGVALVASRTSPTDMAVRICREKGVTLVGYVRGGRFNVYTHPGRLLLPADGDI